MQNKILNSIIVVLLVLMVGALGWYFFFGRGPALPKPNESLLTKSTTPQAKVLSARALEIKKTLTKTDRKIGDLVLANKPEFEITYLIYNQRFSLEIKKAPFDNNKEKAETWFKDQGFNSDDLCLLRISFIAKKEVRETLLPTDVVPTGCDPPDPITPAP